MATKQKNAGDTSEVKSSDAKLEAVPTAQELEAKQVEAYQLNKQRDLDRREKEGTSKYPAVRTLSGSELAAYKNQTVDTEKAERFLAQKDKEEYWRNKKEQKRKKSET